MYMPPKGDQEIELWQLPDEGLSIRDVYTAREEIGPKARNLHAAKYCKWALGR